MAVRSIFARAPKRVVVPEREAPLMRVLEPRVLLDAAALETALDVAEQAVHSDLAEIYLSPEAKARPAAERTPFAVHRSAAFADLEFERLDADLDVIDPAADRTGEIVFIDAGVPDVASLISGIGAGVEIHVLDAESDGVAQMAVVLAGRNGLDAVHVISHGSAGQLTLGDATLDRAGMEGAQREHLATIGAALAPDADLLVYGCNFGAGAEGRAAAVLLAQATGADVAVSEDLTGAAGDWDLELKAGEVEARAFQVSSYGGTLTDGYRIAPTGQPTLGHVGDGVVGTLNTTARWSGAVTFDDGAGTVETYDLVAQFIGSFGDTSVSFETSGDDVRIRVTNIGEVDGGTGLSDPGAVTVQWRIVKQGTDIPAPDRAFDIFFDDLDGLGGVPDTGDGVTIDTANLSAYTLDANTNLTDFADSTDLGVFGTRLQAPGQETGQVGLRWDGAREFRTTFHTRNTSTVFDMDGDYDHSFANGVTVRTQEVDLDVGDRSGATDGGFNVVYRDHAGIQDAGAPVADATAVLRDLNDALLQDLTVTLTNASAGDMLVHDAALAATFGLDVQVTNLGGVYALTVTPVDPFSEGVLTQHLESWLRTVTYRNDDATFDQSYDRTVTVAFSDNLKTSDPATATISFAAATTQPAHAPVSYTGDEGTTISRTAAAGILADVVAPGGTATITAAFMADDAGGANPITPGAAFTTPAGAQLLIGADGAFSYQPAPYASGAEVVRLTITSGGQSVESWVTFDVAPVADAPVLSIAPADGSAAGSDFVSLEDEATDMLDVSVSVADPSQTLELLVEGVPEGAVLTDGTNTYLSNDPFQPVDVTNWQLSTLTVLPPENSDNEITLTFIAYSEEVNLEGNDAVQDVTFTINAVADNPILLINPASAAIDADVSLGRAIDLNVLDEDGSEELVSMTITDIPAEVTFFVDGVARNADFSGGGLGTLTLLPSEIDGLTMSAPKDGLSHDYTFRTFATSREANPNGAVAQATAVEGPVSMVISINALDDPVTARPDRVSAVSGGSVPIDLFGNDDIPDGGETLVEINGTTIDRNTPVDLPGGEGRVSIEQNGVIFFTASPTFSGTAVFEYTVADDDFDIDTSTVIVDVEPRWNVEAGPIVQEGDDATFSFVIDGMPDPGERLSVVPYLTADTADDLDYGDFDTAMNAAVAADATNSFSWDGSELLYEAPQGPYVADHRPGAGGYDDIQASGLQLRADDDSIIRVDLGFDFPFFDNTFREAFVSANGYLTFGSPGGNSVNEAMDGSALGSRPAIAAFWDNLSAAGPLDIYVQAALGPDGARTTTIQFDVGHAGGSEPGSFQIVLHEATGRVEIRYADVDFGNAAVDGGGSATIGVQGAGFGTTFSFNSASVAAGSVVTFDMPRATRPQLDVALPTVDDTDFEGQERFFVQIANATGAALGETSATVTIDVSDNTDPDATNDALSTTKVQPITANLVLGTLGATVDTDAEGHSLVLVEVEGQTFTPGQPITLASGAIVRPEPDGSVLYDPNGAFDGLNVGQQATDTFTYTVSDGFGGTDTATVTVTIDGLNMPPAIDLNGGAAGSDNGVGYADIDPPVAVAPAMTLSDIDDTEFPSLTMELSGFLQGADEKLSIRGTLFAYGQARTATLNIAGVMVDVAYDGATTLSVTRNGGGEMPPGAVVVLVRSITYQNDAGFVDGGDRTITFTVSDGTVPSNEAVATISVASSNGRPDAVDDGPFAGTEDVAQTIAAATLLANDSDPDGDAFDLVGVTDGLGGTVSIDANGDIVFTPDADHEGAADFRYTVRDVNGAESSATVSLNLSGVNDATRLDLNGAAAGANHAAAYVEDGPGEPIVPADATLEDPDDTQLEYAYIQLTNGQAGDRIVVGVLPPGIAPSISPAAAGTTGLAGPATVTVALTGTASRADYLLALQAIAFETASDRPDTRDRTFDVAVYDGDALSTVVRTTMSVAATNDAPDAQDDGVPAPIGGTEDTALRVAIAQLMSNDSDPDGDTLAFVSAQDGINGTVARDGADLVFTPDADHFGAASFTYTVRDAAGEEATATVSLDFASANDAPALDLDPNAPARGHQTAYTENGAPIAIAAADATLTDIDSPDLAGLTVRLTNGRAGDVLAAAGLPAGISAAVSPAAPLAADGTLTLTLTGTAPRADYEAALRLVTFASASDAPTADQRVINVTVTDGQLSSLSGTALIDVTETPDDPTAVADAFTVAEDATLAVPVADLLLNDTDPDGETPTFVSVQDAVNGTVSVAGGTVTFVPDADFSGAASFTYTIRDAAGATSTATVSVDVTPVNDLPTLDLDANTTGRDHLFTYNENDPATPLVDASVALADADDAQLVGATIRLTNGQVGDVIEAVGLPAGLSISVVPAAPLVAAGPMNVQITGTAPLADYEAALASLRYRSTSENPSEEQREVTVRVSDGDDTSFASRVLIDVVSINEDPTIGVDGPFPVFEDSVATVAPATLIANDFDPDGDPVTFDGVLNAVNGTVAVNAQGMIVFTPDADHSGPASFDYTIIDGQGGTRTGTVAVNVLPVNDAPVMDANGAAAGADHAVAYTENDPAVALVDPGFSLTDVDDTEIEFLNVLLANGQTGDLLEVGTLPAGITANVAPTGALVAPGSMTVTLIGPAAIADFEAAVAGLTFRSVSERPVETDRRVQLIAGDGDAVSNLVNVTVAVTAVNDEPVANPDGPFTTAEDTPLVLTLPMLTANDVDADFDALSVTQVSAAVGGTATLANGVVTFTPDPDTFGTATFDYTITDGNGGTSSATATVNVTPVDDAPTVDLDATAPGTGHAVSYVEDDPAVAIVAPSFAVADVDSPQLSGARVQLLNGQVGDVIEAGAMPAGIDVQIVPSGPLVAPGALVVTLSGTADVADYEAAIRALTYRSASQAPSGIDRLIDVAVNDGTSESDVARATIAVTSVNDDPVANADAGFATDEDTNLVVTAAQLTANDTDADGDVLSVTGVSNAVGGTVSLDANGLVTFVPTADYAGPAGFDYTVADGQGGTATAAASIDVRAVDDAPTLDLSSSQPGRDHAFLYIENDAPTPVVAPDIRIEDVDSTTVTSATIVLTNGRAGDVLDVSGLPPAITATTVPAGPLAGAGTITLTLTGNEIPAVYEFALQAVTFASMSETPDETPRRLEIAVSDGTTTSALAVTTINVMAVNDAPVAAPLTLQGTEDTPLSFDATDGATDLDGDLLVVSSIEGTAVSAGGTVTIGSGTVQVAGDGRTLTFTPNGNLNGQVAFAYELFDGRDASGSTVTIDIAAVNDVPEAVDDTVALDEDTSATFGPTGNDTDGDGDALAISVIGGQPASPGGTVSLPEGDVTVGLDGRTLTFTPLANYNGTLVVPYSVTDGQGGSDEATITFEVAAVNDPLTLLGQPPAVTYDDGSDVSIDMAAYVSDPDGDPISYAATGLPAGLAIDPTTGLVTGRLEANASATSPYGITVTADDGMGSTIPVSFQLTAVNVAPVKLADPTVPVRDGDIVSWSATTALEDRDGDVLAFTAIGLPAWLSLDGATGEVSGVVPFDASQGGPVTFTVTATDPSGAFATASVTFEPSNPAPVVYRPLTTLYAGEEQEVVRDLTDFVRDGGMDGDDLTWSVTGLPDGVTFDPATTTISGAPAKDTMRADGYEVAIRVEDGEGGVLDASFTFFVGDVNALPSVDPFDVLALPDAADGAAGDEPIAPIISDTVDEVADLGGIADTLDVKPEEGGLALGRADRGAVIAAVEGVASLSVAAEAASSDDVATQVRAIVADADALTTSSATAAFALTTARPEPTIEYVLDENGDLVVVFNEAAPAEAEAEDDGPTVIEVPDLSMPTVRTDEDAPATSEEAEKADGAKSEKAGSRPTLDVAAHVRPGQVFVDVRDAVLGGTGADIVFALREEGDVIMNVVRNGFATFGVPVDLVSLGLTLAARLPDGTLVVEDVDVDAKTGSVRVVEPTSDRARPAEPAYSLLP